MIHFTVVEGIPKKGLNGHSAKEMTAILEGFMRQETKFARVEHWRSTYKSVQIAQRTLLTAIQRRGLPIKVRMRDTELYFERTDM